MTHLIPQIKTALLLLLLGVIIGSLISMVVIALFLGSLAETQGMHTALFLGELFIPLPILIWANRHKESFQATFRINKISCPTGLRLIPLGVGLVIVTDELDRLIRLFWEPPENFAQIQEIMIMTGPWSAIFILGVVVVLAPLFEELVFRGFFQRIMEYRTDVTKAVLYSALLFTLVHFNPWWAIQIYVVGFFLAYVAWRSNSIWSSFGLHALNNGVAVWFAHQSTESLDWYLWHGHVQPLILMVGMGLLFFGMRAFISKTPVVARDNNVILAEEVED